MRDTSREEQIPGRTQYLAVRCATDWFKEMGAARVVVRKKDLASLAQQDLLQFLQ